MDYFDLAKFIVRHRELERKTEKLREAEKMAQAIHDGLERLLKEMKGEAHA
ncbi:MAG: hypothetical protein SFH39_00480 [Candidatus Magnetobacterium sp. LHC-1]